MRAGFLKLALLSVALLTPAVSLAQGCSLCRDATAGSSPQARRALQKAIPILGVPALGIFAVVLVLAVKTRPGQNAG